jgi:FtsZ-binding cell division protein ZapB
MKQPAAESRLSARLDELAAKIDAAVELIARLRRENRELEERLAAAEQRRAAALAKLAAILDRIDALL